MRHTRRLIGACPGTLLQSRGTAPVLVFNTDLTNNVYLGSAQNVLAQQEEYTTLRPLGSIVLDGTEDTWACSSAPVVVELSPATSITPAPSDIALQMIAAGLAKDTSVLQVNSTLGTPAQDPTVSGLPAGMITAGMAKDTSIQAVNTTTSNIYKQDFTQSGLTLPGVPIAQHIYDVGVPLFVKSGNLITANSATPAIGAGANLTLNNAVPVTVGQTGYEIWLQVWEDSPGTNPFCEIALTWRDSVTGQITATDIWDIALGTAAANAQTIIGRGPTKGDSLDLTIYNNDTTPMSFYVILNQNSRVYHKDDWRTMDAMPSVTGYTTLAGMPWTDAMGSFYSSSVAAGASVSNIMIPFFAGRVFVHFDSNSNAADAEFVMRAVGSPYYAATNVVYDNYTNSQGNLNVDFVLPRAQCAVTITNHNSAAKALRFSITAFDN